MLPHNIQNLQSNFLRGPSSTRLSITLFSEETVFVRFIQNSRVFYTDTEPTCHPSSGSRDFNCIEINAHLNSEQSCALKPCFLDWNFQPQHWVLSISRSVGLKKVETFSLISACSQTWSLRDLHRVFFLITFISNFRPQTSSMKIYILKRLSRRRVPEAKDSWLCFAIWS